jgi:hypothetical protein
MNNATTPSIGRIVIYRTDGRNGLSYDVPAIVNCTIDTHPGNYPDGKHNPLPVPESDLHVHLTVFTPGGYGTKTVRDDTARPPANDAAFVGADSIVPGSGTYVELNVPYDGIIGDDPDSTEVAPRSWRWPTIVR